MKKKTCAFKAAAIVLWLFSFHIVKAENWILSVSEPYQNDAAIVLAAEDIDVSLQRFGDNMTSASFPSDRFVAVLAPTAVLSEKIPLLPLSELKLGLQGCRIVSQNIGAKKVITIYGGSITGLVYGLYRLWDRILVENKIPAMELEESPLLEFRVAEISTKEDMRRALQRRITTVTAAPLNDIIPWDDDSLRVANAGHLARFRDLVDYAHSLHLQFLLYSDEFTFHPSLLKNFGATLNPEDERMWDALQEKYRMAFSALPELDGVMIRTGELTQAGDLYCAYDVMHGEEDSSDWSLEKRYRTFVKRMHEVVVGEFDKIYFHRTWVTTDYEQHSKAQVFRKIFTDDVPTKNLFLSPYVNAHDRWFFTAYNPTFNQTRHNMAVLLAPMDYHANYGVPVFPTYPGPYFQAALQTYFMHPKPNLKGAHFAVTADDEWNTWNLTSYTASRLAWNPDEDVRQIARDFCAIYFGPEAADGMADLYMMSAAAYKYGLYIEPASRGSFNTLPQLRLTTFPVMGFPAIDGGREHIDFLKKIYLQCKPWQEETLLYLDHGLSLAQQMVEKFKPLKQRIQNQQRAQDVENSLQLTHGLIRTNNLYVRAILAYFSYLEQSTAENRALLFETKAKLASALDQFKSLPNCRYKTFGIDQLVKSIDGALVNVEAAKRALGNAPSVEQIKAIVGAQQQRYKQVLAENRSTAKKFLHWQGRIDGRDILLIHGRDINMEHLRWDPGQTVASEIYLPLPERAVTVIVEDLESRAMHPFVLEQPASENNFTAKIYLYDEPGGTGNVKFNLWYIDKTPEQVGLQIPWSSQSSKGNR